MSLILEALSRARREQHNAAPVPGVDSEHYYAAPAPSPWRQRGLLATLALALLVSGVLLGREFSRDGIESPAAVTERQATVAEAPVAVSVPVVATPAAQAAPPATAGTGTSAEVAALYQQPTAPEESAEPATTTSTAPASASEEPVDIASLVTAAEQALEDVRLTEHAAPFLGDLSQQRKDAVPTLMYLQHDFRSEGGSTVTINGQQTRAGQSVGSGVKVEEILPDSVVLSHAGQQFRLRALNSWVNL